MCKTKKETPEQDFNNGEEELTTKHNKRDRRDVTKDNEATFSPERQAGTTRSLRGFAPKFSTGGSPMLRPPKRAQTTPPEPQRESSSIAMSSWK
jgi:hypothetical protein